MPRPSFPALSPADGARRRSGWADALVLVAAVLWLSALWNLPVDLGDLDTPSATTTWPALLLPALSSVLLNASVLDAAALEIVLLVGAMALIPWLRSGPAAVLVRHGVAVLSLLLVVLSLTDLGMHMVLGRAFAPLLDLGLYAHVIDLQKGSFQGVTGWMLTGLQLLAAALVYGLSLKAVAAVQRVTASRPLGPLTLAVSACLTLSYLGLKLLPAGPAIAAHEPPVHARASETVWSQLERSRRILSARAAFEKAAAVDPLPPLPPERLLARLGDVDVLLVFFESYGRSVLNQPSFQRQSLPALEAFEQALKANGLASASGYLTSPIAGGQSWLAHATLESGLWVEHQSYYDAFLQADRLTLTRAFAQRGHRTVAMKPAIVMPWPEGARFGFERVYAAADMGYAGRPYNWVTMPDQYTFAAFERFERQAADRDRPVFAEFSLISSHAPWTQIPPLVQDWSSIGDGRIFSAWADLGDPPHVVWADPARIRAQYAKSVRYVLDVLASYAAAHVDDRTLMIVVGDHQPAPLVTGEGVSRDVPIHVVSGDPGLVEPFLAFGLAAGMRPDETAPVRRMDAFRDWFLKAFSDGLPAKGDDPS